jgi:hypothetical protein
MVRAILDGRKTQTRRVVKPQPTEETGWGGFEGMGYLPVKEDEEPLHCPYGRPGDHLWVRENYTVNGDGMFYSADGSEIEPSEGAVWEGKEGGHPSIHMPRWASRITLEVTGVWVEQVQQIRNVDARAEGCDPPEGGNYPRIEYAKLWDRINGKKFPWASNPWVWVVEFRRVKP